MTAALIPTGYETQGYTCVQSLSRHGIDTIIASEKPRVPAGASRHCTESLSVSDPRADLLAYRDDLLELARRPAVKTVVPIRPDGAYLLSRYRDEFEAATDLFVPSFDQFRTVADRLRLVEAAESGGVPVPSTARLGEVEEWSGEQIVKSRYNVLAEGVVPDREPTDMTVEKSLTHLAAGEAPDAEALSGAMGHEPIVQEYIPSTAEYMIGALYDHGEPLAMFQHRQIRGDTYAGGGGVYRESVAIPELEAAARALLDELDWHGLACIEYMRHEETGEFYLTEINPRMWQSLPSTVRAGADFPLYYWLAARGREDEIDCSYDLGVGTHSLHGELRHLLSIVRTDSSVVAKPPITRRAREILVSCLREPNFDYLTLDDPGPFIRGVRNELSWRR
ncbi:ATP-grasp domain-containing protein [Haloarcula laminariae]|uniref:carboxylate--amine ligase n=1 Tax=Haloarcula laminariae TaxID=2961577 RepID=UPI0021C65BAD|nr:ATP-grasp domain-containing protein [Halomicroarcula laminariae]